MLHRRLVSFAISLAFTAIFGFAITAAADQAKGTETVPGQPAVSGELEFRQYCVQCHGMEGTGNGPVAQSLQKRPANLRLLSKNNGGVFPEELVRGFVDGRKTSPAHGSREMPIWGSAFQTQKVGMLRVSPHPISPDEVKRRIDMLVDYIKSIQMK